MKRIINIFTVLSLLSLPCFAENNTISFNIKGQFVTDQGMTPSGLSVKIKEPAECKFAAHNQNIMHLISDGIVNDTITCPTGTESVTLEFISNQGTSFPKYKVQKPQYKIELKSNKKKYTIPEIKLIQITNSNTKTTPTTQKPAEQVAPQSTSEPATETEPALHSDCTEQIDNAARAIYTKKNKEIVCTLKECKCGYEIQNNKCVSWGENPPKCKITNAELATKQCDNKNKEICTVTKCKNGYKEDNNKCIKETTDKIQNDTQTTLPKGGDTESHSITITDEDDLTTKDIKKITKEYAPQIVCTKTDKNKYGTVTALCANNKITINCAGKKSSDPITDEIRQNIIKGICPNATADNNFKLEINESKEVTKEAATKTQAEKCATGGNGTWDDKKDKCNCNSGYVLDNDGKCVTETTAFKNAKENLESFGTALTNALNKIKAAAEQKQ